MGRRWWLAVLVLVVGLASCSPAEQGGDQAAERGPIKVGAVLDLTGAGASLGAPQREVPMILPSALVMVEVKDQDWTLAPVQPGGEG